MIWTIVCWVKKNWIFYSYEKQQFCLADNFMWNLIYFDDLHYYSISSYNNSLQFEMEMQINFGINGWKLFILNEISVSANTAQANIASNLSMKIQIVLKKCGIRYVYVLSAVENSSSNWVCTGPCWPSFWSFCCWKSTLRKRNRKVLSQTLEIGSRILDVDQQQLKSIAIFHSHAQ